MDLRMKQEKSSQTLRRLYETHIFAKFLDFGQKILLVIYLKVVVPQQNLDSWILPNEK